MRLTKDMMRDQARALKGALAANGVALRYTNALDLVAASHGLRDRAVPVPPGREAAATPSKLLQSAIARYARHDAARRAALMAGVEAITHPTPIAEEAGAAATFEHAGVELRIAPSGLADPCAWLASPAGQAWLAKATAGAYHSGHYDHQRSPYDLKVGNRIADDVLDNKRQSEPRHADDVLEEHLGEATAPEESYREQLATAMDQFLDDLVEAAEDADLQVDRDEWDDAVREAACGKLAEDDTSSVRDLLGSYDACEVVFMMGDPGLGYEDNAITSVESWTGPSTLHPDGHLQAQLASIGWRMPEFLKSAGNTNPRGSGVAARKTPLRAEKLVDYATLEEAVENVCARNFTFCLYAIVPIEDVVDIDLAKPMRFEKAAFACYDCVNGSFYDAKTLSDVVVTPRQGRLESPGRWYGPDDICGLVYAPYRSRLRNVAATTNGTEKTGKRAD